MKYTFKIYYFSEYLEKTEKRVFTIQINDNISFLQLFKKFDRFLKISKEEKTNVTRLCSIKISNNRWVTPIANYCFQDFVNYNCLNINAIKVSYGYGGVGAASRINDKLSIEIRANEHNHGIYRPHIHISNSKGRNAVVFSLIDLRILEGEKNWDKYFTKKEKKLIVKMLKEYKSKFRKFYEDQFKGITPYTVTYEYDRHEYDLSYYV